MALLRVLTLNCWNVSEPYAERMELIRDGIRALDPDLVGLQEIVVRREGLDMGAEILGGLGYQTAFGAAFRWSDAASNLPHDADGDGFGNLVAARWPIERSAVHPLPGVESGERRSVLAALVATPHGRLAFLTTHFNWKFHHGHVRERQAIELAAITRRWAREATLPPIVTGDLNAEPDSAEIRYLCGLQSLGGGSTYLQDAWRVGGGVGRGYTWDNRNPYAGMVFEPSRRIDYVLVGLPDAAGRGTVMSARVVLDEPRGDVFPSDHFGVLAEIRV
ncbi:MAG: endonuclease/exonuclease/phosphatase family protein [Thermodesulfobacteriota bacterium]